MEQPIHSSFLHICEPQNVNLTSTRIYIIEYRMLRPPCQFLQKSFCQQPRIRNHSVHNIKSLASLQSLIKQALVDPRSSLDIKKYLKLSRKMLSYYEISILDMCSCYEEAGMPESGLFLSKVYYQMLSVVGLLAKQLHLGMDVKEAEVVDRTEQAVKEEKGDYVAEVYAQLERSQFVLRSLDKIIKKESNVDLESLEQMENEIRLAKEKVLNTTYSSASNLLSQSLALLGSHNQYTKDYCKVTQQHIRAQKWLTQFLDTYYATSKWNTEQSHQKRQQISSKIMHLFDHLRRQAHLTSTKIHTANTATQTDIFFQFQDTSQFFIRPNGVGNWQGEIKDTKIIMELMKSDIYKLNDQIRQQSQEIDYLRAEKVLLLQQLKGEGRKNWQRMNTNKEEPKRGGKRNTREMVEYLKVPDLDISQISKTDRALSNLKKAKDKRGFHSAAQESCTLIDKLSTKKKVESEKSVKSELAKEKSQVSSLTEVHGEDGEGEGGSGNSAKQAQLQLFSGAVSVQIRPRQRLTDTASLCKLQTQQAQKQRRLRTQPKTRPPKTYQHRQGTRYIRDTAIATQLPTTLQRKIQIPSNIVFDGISQKKPMVAKPMTANHYRENKLPAKLKFYDRIEKIEMIDRLERVDTVESKESGGGSGRGGSLGEGVQKVNTLPSELELPDKHHLGRRNARRMNTPILPKRITFTLSDMQFFGGQQQALNLQKMQYTQAKKKIRVSNLTNISLLRRKAFQHRSMAQLNLLLKRQPQQYFEDDDLLDLFDFIARLKYAFPSNYNQVRNFLRYPYSFLTMQEDPIWEVHNRDDPDLSLFDFRRIIKRIWKIHRKCEKTGENCWHIESFFGKIGFWEGSRSGEGVFSKSGEIGVGVSKSGDVGLGFMEVANGSKVRASLQV